jgi:hypothetical protein
MTPEELAAWFDARSRAGQRRRRRRRAQAWLRALALLSEVALTLAACVAIGLLTAAG